MSTEGLRMVELKGQYEKIKDRIDQAVSDVLASCQYINGPEVLSFSRDLEKYLDVSHVIPCGNGADAILAALMALGLQEGDEVITADFTFAATVEVILFLKFTPVLVDIDEKTFNIDVAALKKAITPKTKAIIPVRLFGQCAAMEDLLEVAQTHKLFVIEDAAQAAVLKVKLPYLERYNQARRKAADHYDARLASCPKIRAPYRDEKRSTHIFHQYTIQLQDVERGALQKHLLEKGIPSMIYYPVPLHRQRAYQSVRNRDENFPVTNRLVDQALSLPIHTELDEEQLDYISDALLEF